MAKRGASEALALMLLFFLAAAGWTEGGGVAAVSSASTQEGVVKEFRVTLPQRDRGFFIGDAIEAHASVVLDKGAILDDRALAQGRMKVSETLECVITFERSRKKGMTAYRITFFYQVFALARETTPFTIPAYALPVKYDGNDGTDHESRIEIPGFIVTFSSLLAANEGFESRAPLAFPVPASGHRVFRGASAAGAVAFVMMAGVIAPFAIRRVRQFMYSPFRRAAKTVRKAKYADEVYAAVHAAIGEYAGEAQFASGVSVFMAKHPRFTPFGEALKRFFAEFDRKFFGNPGSASEVENAREPAKEALRLLKNLERARRAA